MAQEPEGVQTKRQELGLLVRPHPKAWTEGEEALLGKKPDTGGGQDTWPGPERGATQTSGPWPLAGGGACSL